MKKLMYLLMLSAFLTAGCNDTSTLSISEIENVPKEVQQKIDSNYSLQKIEESENTFYIVFYSKSKVKTFLESKGSILEIELSEEGEESEEIEQHIYKLTIDPEHQNLDIFINGEKTSFENVTSL